ncbi:hypothetical protein [Clostridium sp. JS66]|nr:hypothetical protein [Clostridium sp. JS66]WPC41142.1 hypothetical protein Q6H37_25120 [Clostridium sp. JS66]
MDQLTKLLTQINSIIWEDSSFNTINDNWNLNYHTSRVTSIVSHSKIPF